ncbi:MAG: PilZ domain-containing protein [Candidatus Omnitrophota bacterium]
MHYDGIEKRKFHRVRCPCKILIHNIPERSITTHTENISAGGIRILTEGKIDTNSAVDIEIKLKEQTITCKGKVVWVVDRQSPYKKGIIYHDTGIEFHGIKDGQRDIIHNFIKFICK